MRRDIDLPILGDTIDETYYAGQDFDGQFLDKPWNVFDKHANKTRVKVFWCEGLRIL